MRTTTELTARFSIEIVAIPQPMFAENCDAPVGSIEYWEAVERDQAREDIDALDALDFATVSFESVEEELAVELFEQDLADERQFAAEHGHCTNCGATSTWDQELHILGKSCYCIECLKVHLRVATSDLAAEVAEQRFKAERRKEAKRWLEAFETAKTMRPDMNWDQFEYVRKHNMQLAR